jgi:hypothetical protein
MRRGEDGRAARDAGQLLLAWELLRPQEEDPVSDATPTAPGFARPQPHASRVYVTLADLDGWDMYVEVDGCVVLTEHCADWHRVERRRATLAADLGRARARRGDSASAAAP